MEAFKANHSARNIEEFTTQDLRFLFGFMMGLGPLLFLPFQF